jgi:magnesium-transporting ATPase (P-type)
MDREALALQGKEFMNRQFDDEIKQKILERFKQVWLAMIIATIANAALTYYALKIAPGYFIEQKISESFVDIWTINRVPFILIFSLIIAFMIIAVGYYSIKKGSIRYLITGYGFLGFGIVFTLSQIYEGVTWISVILAN